MHLRDLGALPFAHLLGLRPPTAAGDEYAATSLPAASVYLQTPDANEKGGEEGSEKDEERGDADNPEQQPGPEVEPEKDDEEEAKPSAGEAAARIQSIVTSQLAVGSYAALGAFLAFSTQLSAGEAETVMQLAHAAADADGNRGRRQSLDERMQAAGAAANPQLGAEMPPPPAGAEAAAAAILAAARKARGQA